MELNNDIETRDKIILGRFRPNKYKFNNVCPFSNMDATILGQLIEQHFIDPEEWANKTCTVSDIYEFLKDYPDYTVHGYMKLDGGIIIEGVEKGRPVASTEEFQRYMNLFKSSARLDTTTMYCAFK